MSQYPKISLKINQLAKADQRLRAKVFSKTIGSTDSERKQLEKLDLKNSRRLKEIVNSIGLPTISKVGRTTSFNAWLIVQHCPDLLFQKEYLKLLKTHQRDIDKRNIAYLEDGILRREGKPQKYGTQVYFDQRSKKHKLQKTCNPKKLDARRKKMGLELIESYLQNINKKYV